MGWVLMSERDVRRIEVLTGAFWPADDSFGWCWCWRSRPGSGQPAADLEALVMTVAAA